MHLAVSWQGNNCRFISVHSHTRNIRVHEVPCRLPGALCQFSLWWVCSEAAAFGNEPLGLSPLAQLWRAVPLGGKTEVTGASCYGAAVSLEGDCEDPPRETGDGLTWQEKESVLLCAPFSCPKSGLWRRGAYWPHSLQTPMLDWLETRLLSDIPPRL